MAAPTTMCYGDKIKQQHIAKPSSKPSKVSELDQASAVESYHSRTDTQDRCERVRASAPDGFHELLQKVIRAVILSRPVHIYRFIADMLEVELTRRTFDEITYGCALKKSQKLEPYPSESCKLLISFLEQRKMEVFGEDQFMMGPIPDYDLRKPALDRYRDYAGIGVFDMASCEPAPEPSPIQTAELKTPQELPVECAPAVVTTPVEEVSLRAPAFDKGPIPDYELAEPAIDRYRDYAGIEPFEFDHPCADHEPLCRLVNDGQLINCYWSIIIITSNS